MKHPYILVMLLCLSMLRVTYKFFIASDLDSDLPDKVYLIRQRDRSNILNETVITLHEEIQKDIDVQTPLRFHSKDFILQLYQRNQQYQPSKDFQRVVPYTLWYHGHLLFVSHKNHGMHRVDQLLETYRQHDIAVDAVVLDAFWWDPRDVFQPHPQRYGNGFRFASSPAKPQQQQQQKTSHVNDNSKPFVELKSGWAEPRSTAETPVIVWVSAMVPSSTRQYAHGRNHSYFLHRGNAHRVSAYLNFSEPHQFDWQRNDGPSIFGPLVDFTNPNAVKWFAEEFITFLEDNPSVMGVRCAGVDALLTGVKDVFGHIGHVDWKLYRKLYYRFFLDLGRRIRGSDFAVVGRGIDSFGNYHFQTFAPRDALFAGFVGDHPFTFSGLKESAMNVVQSAYHCYLNMGSMIGGSFEADDEQTRESFDAWWRGQELADSHTDDTRQELMRALRLYREAEAFPADVVPLLGNRDINESRRIFTTCARDERRMELFQRWVQWASMLPTMLNGGLLHGSHLPWTYSPQTSLQYQQLTAEHRSLALYYAAAAARSFTHFFDPAHHHQTSAKTKTGSRYVVQLHSDHCTMTPLRSQAITFLEPVDGLEWAMRLGNDLILIPCFDSFGGSHNVSREEEEANIERIIRRIPEVWNGAALRRRTEAELTTSHSGANRDFFSGGGSVSSGSDALEEWVLLAQPEITVLRVDSGGTIVLANPQSPKLALRTLVTPTTYGPPAMLRRQRAMIPLLFHMPLEQLTSRNATDSQENETSATPPPSLLQLSPLIVVSSIDLPHKEKDYMGTTPVALLRGRGGSSSSKAIHRLPPSEVRFRSSFANDYDEGHRVEVHFHIPAHAADSSTSSTWDVNDETDPHNTPSRYVRAVSAYVGAHGVKHYGNMSCVCRKGDNDLECSRSIQVVDGSDADDHDDVPMQLLHRRHSLLLPRELWMKFVESPSDPAFPTCAQVINLRQNSWAIMIVSAREDESSLQETECFCDATAMP